MRSGLALRLQMEFAREGVTYYGHKLTTTKSQTTYHFLKTTQLWTADSAPGATTWGVTLSTRQEVVPSVRCLQRVFLRVKPKLLVSLAAAAWRRRRAAN